MRDDTAAATRVVVADDHPVVRQGLGSLLAALDGFELVGEAADGSEAISVVARTNPDLVVMDLSMPGFDGIEATRRIVEAHPSISVLVLTMFDDDESLFAALRAGAQGYILKGSPQPDVERALVSCANGDAVFGPSIANRVLRYFDSTPQPVDDPFPELTDRERSILDLIARGSSNAAIADRLGITTKTVRNHSCSIFAKLHVAGRSEAIIRARDEGMGLS